MAVVINTNTDAIKIQNILTNATNRLSASMNKMSTGLKVAEAKDDAAGCVIAAKMQVQLNGNKIAQQNVQSANALLSTAEGNLDVVEDNLVRIRDLTLQAKNGTYSTEEIEAMQKEVKERIEEIQRISDSSRYSDTSLFNGPGAKDSDIKKAGLTFQVGPNKEANNTITASKNIFQSVDITTLTTVGSEAGLASTFDLSKLSAGTGTGSFQDALGKLDKGINNLTDRKALIGSTQNRLESALNSLTTQYENLASAKSIITDADIASEASNYTQQSILQQVSTSLLAQANQAPGVALSLI